MPIEHSDGSKDYPLADDVATLAWFAQIAALELHVPQWRFTHSGGRGRPDRLVLDLDPGPVSVSPSAPRWHGSPVASSPAWGWSRCR
jgi:bifunctional non-homologous end joining protein LigD